MSDANTSSKDVMIDGTLFKSEYHASRAQYCVTSRTPLQEHAPLVLNHWVERIEATQYREGNWVKGHSIDSAAMAIGITELQARIPIELRKLPVSKRVKEEMEELEGYGSF